MLLHRGAISVIPCVPGGVQYVWEISHRCTVPVTNSCNRNRLCGLTVACAGFCGQVACLRCCRIMHAHDLCLHDRSQLGLSCQLGSAAVYSACHVLLWYDLGTHSCMDVCLVAVAH